MIITTRKGRKKSIITKEELTIHAGEMVDALTDAELELVMGLIDEDPELQTMHQKAMRQHLYHRDPVSMEQFIEDPYYLGESCSTIYPELKKDLIELFDYPFREVVLCLHPDTVVPLLNGTSATMSDLISKWEKDREPVWIYSVDEKGAVVPGQAVEPRYTGDDDYYKVELDDGKSFTCNARHRMVMRDGSKRMVKDMSQGDSLMPFETQFSKKTRGRRIEGYELVLDPSDEKLKYTHAIMAEHGFGPIDSKCLTVHHIDFRKVNNEPGNLRVMPWDEHRILHEKFMGEFLAANPECRERLSKRQRAVAIDPDSPMRVGHAEFMASDEGKALAARNLANANISDEERRRRFAMATEERWHGEGSEDQRKGASERMRERNLAGNARSAAKLNWVNRSEEDKKAHSERVALRNSTGPRARLDITMERILEAVDGGAVTINAAAKAVGCSATRIRSVFKKANAPLRDVFKHSKNHHVVSVKKVGHGPVCCLTVPRYENFAIQTVGADGSTGRDGVFSSNTGGIGVGKCTERCSEVIHMTTGERMTVEEAFTRGINDGCATFDYESGETINSECRIMQSGMKKIGHLVLGSGKKVGLTPDHPVLTPWGYKPVGELKRGDLVATSREMPAPEMPLVISDEEVRLVGYLLADGSCTTGTLGFTKACPVIIDEVKDLTVALGGEIGCERLIGETHQFSLCGMVDFKAKFDLNHKSKDRRIPGKFYGLDNRQLALLLNRIFSCDGWFCRRDKKKGNWEIGIALASEPFVKDIQQLLLRFGIHSRMRPRDMTYTHNGEKKHSDAWSLQVLGRDEVVRFLDSIGNLVGKEEDCETARRELEFVKGNSNVDITPMNRDVMFRVRKEIGPVSKRAYWPRPAQGSQMGHGVFLKFAEAYSLPEWCSWWGGVFWDEVESYECGDELEPVYDIEVPKTRNFSVHGIIVHNTFVLSIAICRVLYELSCLVNPQKTFGLSSGTEMVIPLISKNLPLAKAVMKTAVDDKIKESPYFMNEFSPKISKENTMFPHNIRVIIGSYGSERILGSNVFCVGLDECFAKNARIELLTRDGASSMTVGDLLEMSPEDAENCKVVGFDHAENKLKAGWWRIKKSTVQELVEIRTARGSVSPSRKHPVLVRRGDWLVYIHAEDVIPGDFVVMEDRDASEGSGCKRRAEAEAVGEDEGSGGVGGGAGEHECRSEGAIREWACQSNEGEDPVGRDEEEDQRGFEGSQVFRGAQAEDRGGESQKEDHSRDSKEDERGAEEQSTCKRRAQEEDKRGQHRPKAYGRSSCEYEQCPEGQEVLRRSKEEYERGCQEAHWGGESVLWEDSLGGSAEEDERGPGGRREKASFRGDKEKDERVSEGAQVLRRNEEEDERGCESSCIRSGVAKEDERKVEEGVGRGHHRPEYAVQARGGKLVLREEAHGGNEGALERDCKGERASRAYGGVEGCDLRRERAGYQGRDEDVQVSCDITGRRDGALQDGGGEETCRSPLFPGGGRFCCRRRQDAVCRVRARRPGEKDCLGLYGDTERRRGCRGGGEIHANDCKREGVGKGCGNVEELRCGRAQDAACFQRVNDLAVCVERAVRDRGVHFLRCERWSCPGGTQGGFQDSWSYRHVTGWKSCALPWDSGQEVGRSPLFAERCRLCFRDWQEQVCEARSRQRRAEHVSGFCGMHGGRESHLCARGGESVAQAQQTGRMPCCDMGGLQESGIFPRAGYGRIKCSRPGAWSIRDRCVHGERGHWKSRKVSSCGQEGKEEEGRSVAAERSKAWPAQEESELKFAGVRPERTHIEEIPSGLCLTEVVSVSDLPAEQTYSLCTEFQTFIADGFVVHNTNFPPNRKNQQITTAMGQKKTKAHFDIVEKVYRNLVRRIKSRFQVAGGDFPGMIILASSAATLDSFTERKIRESRLDSSVFVRDHTQWTAKPGSNFCGEKFWVLCAASSMRSRIVSDEEAETFTDEWLEENDCFLIDIPVEYKSDFEMDLENALRDLAGISTQAISIYIQRPDAVDACVSEEMEHPFTVYEWTSGLPGAFKWNMMCESFERTLTGGYTEIGWAPRINPSKMRWCHIDTSLSGDCTGFCVGHIDKWVEVVRRDGDGAQYTELTPSYVIDVMLRVNPPSGEQIYMPDLRRFIYELQAHGYQFLGFSSDTYQSAEMHQQVKRRGIKTHLISTDTSTEPYDELKAAMYENRIRFYHYQPFIEEIKGLEYDRNVGKIDHQQAECFVGETRIPLLDGSCPMISELVEADVWVYSCDEGGRVVPGRARGRLSKEVTELVDVVLDSGAVERCTPEHPWMLRDGTYKQARDLDPGVDRLMPINRTWPINGGYEKVTDSHAVTTLTHHLVWTYLNGPLLKGECVHHLNGNKVDNSPENIRAELRSDHSRMHTTNRHRDDELYREAVLNGLKRFNLSDRGRASHGDAMARINESRSFESRVKSSRKRPAFRSDVNIESLLGVKNEDNANAAARAIKCGRNVVMRVLKDNGFVSWDAFQRGEAGVNHKVRYVIPVHLEKPVAVYDLEVDDYSNFALSSGVFVHNSKDVSDAVAGVVYGLMKTSTKIPAIVGDSQSAAINNEYDWVSPMIQTDGISAEELRDMKDAADTDVSEYVPIVFGD